MGKKRDLHKIRQIWWYNEIKAFGNMTRKGQLIEARKREGWWVCRLEEKGFKLINVGGPWIIFQNEYFRVALNSTEKVYALEVMFQVFPKHPDVLYRENLVKWSTDNLKDPETLEIICALDNPENLPVLMGIEWMRDFIEKALKDL